MKASADAADVRPLRDRVAHLERQATQDAALIKEGDQRIADLAAELRKAQQAVADLYTVNFKRFTMKAQAPAVPDRQR
jgi:hypothetical protein